MSASTALALTVFRRAGAPLACAAALLATVPAQAMDLTLVGGFSEKNSVKKAGVIAGWNRAEPLWAGQSWELALRHELELAGWRVPEAKNILELGYSPFLRFQQRGSGTRFFAEASIGVRLLSDTWISDTKTLSTHFQFSDQLGAGLMFGAQSQHTLGVRIQHLSNAGIKRPNPGINFANIYYSYRF